MLFQKPVTYHMLLNFHRHAYLLLYTRTRVSASGFIRASCTNIFIFRIYKAEVNIILGCRVLVILTQYMTNIDLNLKQYSCVN